MSEGPHSVYARPDSDFRCTTCGEPIEGHPHTHPATTVPRFDNGSPQEPLDAQIQIVVTVGGRRTEACLRYPVANAHDLATALARTGVGIGSQLFPRLDWVAQDGISGK